MYILHFLILQINIYILYITSITGPYNPFTKWDAAPKPPGCPAVTTDPPSKPFAPAEMVKHWPGIVSCRYLTGCQVTSPHLDRYNFRI